MSALSDSAATAARNSSACSPIPTSNPFCWSTATKESPRHPSGQGPRAFPHAEAVRAEGLALVFLATPPEVSMELAPSCSTPARASSISAAPSACARPKTTRPGTRQHTQPELLAEAVYGLPEFCRERIPAARLVANPGCYPDRRQSGHPAADRSRRGRPRGRHRLRRQIRRQRRGPQAQPQDQLLRSHRELLGLLDPRTTATCPKCCMISGLEEREFSFTAQLLPLDRGILETIYFRAAGDRQRRGAARHLRAALRRRALRPPLQSRPRARPARRRAHQFLRHRRHLRRRAPGAPWSSAPSTTW